MFAKVVKSYPKLNVPEDIRGEEDLKVWWEKQWSQDVDVLHQVQFYRVVLDGLYRTPKSTSCINKRDRIPSYQESRDPDFHCMQSSDGEAPLVLERDPHNEQSGRALSILQVLTRPSYRLLQRLPRQLL